MAESVTTVVTDNVIYSARPAPAGDLAPVAFSFQTGAAYLQDYLEVDEACAVIAMLQVAVDDVEREGREAFDAHIAGKLADTKFISMPAGVSQDV